MSDYLIAEYRGYRALWSAVILQAFRDLLMRWDPNGGDPLHYRNEAWLWLHERKKRIRVGDFEWICEYLDLDPDILRICSMTRSGINSILNGSLAAYRLSERLKTDEG